MSGVRCSWVGQRYESILLLPRTFAWELPPQLQSNPNKENQQVMPDGRANVLWHHPAAVSPWLLLKHWVGI